MDWIATPEEDESIYEYHNAAHAASAYVQLVPKLGGGVKGIDPAKIKMSHTNPKYRTAIPDGINALDEFLVIQRVFAKARASLIRHRPEHGHRWWRCWWAMRIEGAKAGSLHTGYSKASCYTIRNEVDRLILDHLQERQMHESQFDWDAIEQYNQTRAPRVRFWEASDDEG